MSKAGLTPKQERFCEEYLVDLNATAAAERAGYSQKTANEQGSQNLVKLSIQQKIQQLMEDRSERTEIEQDQVLNELASLGFSNIKEYIKSSLEDFVIFKRIDEIPEAASRAIESLKMNVKEGKVEFKLHSKTKALEMLGRHLGMFKDTLEIKTPLSYEFSEQYMPKQKRTHKK